MCYSCVIVTWSHNQSFHNGKAQGIVCSHLCKIIRKLSCSKRTIVRSGSQSESVARAGPSSFALRPHLTPVSWRECLCSPPPLCSPGDRLRFYSYHLTMLNPRLTTLWSLGIPHIRAWKGWPVPRVEWTEGSIQTPFPHRRTPLTHRLPLSHPDLGNDTAPDSKSMMELSKIPFPTPVKTQYRSGIH